MITQTDWHQETLTTRTPGRGTVDLTEQIAHAVRNSGIQIGLCHVFIMHTSASLMLCENADPDVRTDLEVWMGREVPDGDPEFIHTAEGPDDMSAHVRSVLTGSSLNIPITNGRLALGIWQGAYLWEHRTSPHERRVVVTVNGRKDLDAKSPGLA